MRRQADRELRTRLFQWAGKVRPLLRLDRGRLNFVRRRDASPTNGLRIAPIARRRQYRQGSDPKTDDCRDSEHPANDSEEQVSGRFLTAARQILEKVSLGAADTEIDL